MATDMLLDAGSVLVIDDDDSICEFLTTALSDEGYTVTTARNGWVALAGLDAAAPDLILLDMRMPVLNGWEFANCYRARGGPHAPVVVMTAARDAAARAAQVEAEAYLAKPCDLDDLLDVTARFVRLSRSAR
jgi:CheY-like chemotaxis protein